MSINLNGITGGGHWGQAYYGGGNHAAGQGHHAAGHGHHPNAHGSEQVGASLQNGVNEPFSLSRAYVRVDKVGTKYISSGMVKDKKTGGGENLYSKTDYDRFIDAHAKHFGLDPELVKRQYRVESCGDRTHMGDTNRNWDSGGPSIGLLQVTSGILDGGVWAKPGVITENDTGRHLTSKELVESPAMQLLAGMQHLADYKNEAGANAGVGRSPEAIYKQSLGGYVGHDQDSYIKNIETMQVS